MYDEAEWTWNDQLKAGEELMSNPAIYHGCW